MDLKVGDGGVAQLTWSPQKIGEYSVEVMVGDSGNPQQQDRASFRVSVTDPPPETTDDRPRVEGFDDATQTFLVGTVTSGDVREAWFSIRTKGQLLKLSLGDSLDVGSMKGEISRIEEQSVEIGTADGPLRVRIGQTLSEGTLATPPSRQADSRS
jgi:hypothetical protein